MAKRTRRGRARCAPIAITTGDHRGIGPEVIAKGLNVLIKRKRLLSASDVIIFGIPELYRPFKRLLPTKWQVWTENDIESSSWPGPVTGHLNFVVPYANHIEPSRRAAYSCGRYVELATLGAIRGVFSAVTTGPIDKNELHRGGYRYDGHTEMLKDLCKSPSVTMMMAGLKMRTTLVTTHEALRDVSRKLSADKVGICIDNTLLGLSRDFGIKRPKIAVLGLNPHASDGGLFGDEEKTIIEPAIAMARTRFPKSLIDGPFPPDGFFAQWQQRYSKTYDAIVCMYHDQGLIPIKLLDFENTVNVSLGLPIVRTSVDHGVGYDIAGKNQADAASFCAALKLAASIVKRRGKHAQK